MLVTIALTLSIIIFCFAIHREEKRRNSKLILNSSDSTKSDSEVNENNENNESVLLKKQLREKEEIICKLRAELKECNEKMETYLSLTKTSQELVLRNDERVQTVNKLWEDKNLDLEKQVNGLNEEVVRLRRQIEKADDELNSHQHKVYNLNRLLQESEDRVEELESQLEQLADVDEKCHQQSLRIQRLQGEIEHLEELRRKESDKFRNLVKDKELKIQQLESICSELRMTTAVTNL